MRGRLGRWLDIGADHAGDLLFFVYAGVVAAGLALAAVLALTS